MNVKIASIGFGTVGQGFVELLNGKKDYLSKKYGISFSVVAISDPIKGSIYDPEGLDLNKVFLLLKEKGSLQDYPCTNKGWDSVKTIEESNADVIVEATPTNLKDGNPGLTHIRKALSLKKHVISTNKGPVALAYSKLKQLAKENGVSFRFEGTVLSGTPALNLSLESLAGAHVQEIRGILNGTTNFILTEMSKGKAYEEALKIAQQLGYAETDPTADVEGWDAVAKTVILSNVVMGGEIRVEDVKREGITNIGKSDIDKAKERGKVIKLIASIAKENGIINAKVSPEEIDGGELLANVNGVLNALVFKTDTLGEVSIIGPGAGRKETGFSLLTDFIHIFTKKE